MTTLDDATSGLDVSLGVAAPIINGNTVAKTSAGAISHVNPATGRVNGSVAMAGAEEIDQAVAVATAGAAEWQGLAPDARRRVLQKIEQCIEDNAEELGRLTTLELGHPNLYTVGQVLVCASWFGYYAGWCDKIEGATIPLTGLISNGFDYTQREPYGVIGHIITWNGPLVSVGMKVAPALAAGNAVVLKSPELAPFATQRLTELALEAGLPPGVLQVLPGGPEAGERLVRHPQVGKISFTGGLPTARRIMAAASESLKPVLFELGGKAANIVFPDADLSSAVALSVGSCFTMGGQGCNLATRLVVHASVYDEVLEMVTAMTATLPVGDPLEPTTVLGPVVTQDAFDRICTAITKSQGSGASRLAFGGGPYEAQALPEQNRNGFYVQPTVLADVDPCSDIAVDEVFGPVLSVMAFREEEEAIALANSTPYGLGTYLHTRDIGRVHRMVPRLHAGTVSVNGVLTTPLPPGAPYGGYKQSGFGREGGHEGLGEFLQTKNVMVTY